MATDDINKTSLCKKCNVRKDGLFMCHGCHESFCWKHTEEHKSELSLQMDIVAQEHDLLREDFNLFTTHHSLLGEIDRWENDSIMKIQKTANLARIDVQKQVQDLKDAVQTSCANVIDGIRLSRESDTFVSEIDIARWMQTLKQMRQQLETVMTIRISNDEQMTPIQMIQIIQETTAVSHKSNNKRKYTSLISDNFLKFIKSIIPRFTLDQFNYLIDLIDELWDVEEEITQVNIIELLGIIGRHCQQESGARVLEILWNMAHDDRLSKGMLQRVLNIYYDIFSEKRDWPKELKYDYCLKCVSFLQEKQRWIVPAIQYLIKCVDSEHSGTCKPINRSITSLLVQKHDLIFILIQSISVCQSNTWNKTDGCVQSETLVDRQFTYEELIKSHLDLISALLKRGNLFLIYNRSEELWDILILNKHASSVGRELGFDWFITCFEDLNRDSRSALFENRVSKLDLTKLSVKGFECFKLYSSQYEKKEI